MPSPFVRDARETYSMGFDGIPRGPVSCRAEPASLFEARGRESFTCGEGDGSHSAPGHLGGRSLSESRIGTDYTDHTDKVREGGGIFREILQSVKILDSDSSIGGRLIACKPAERANGCRTHQIAPPESHQEALVRSYEGSRQSTSSCSCHRDRPGPCGSGPWSRAWLPWARCG
jgi:hypothetical protein